MTPPAAIQLSVRVAGTAHVAPGAPVPTAVMAARLSPAPDPARVEARTGIASRHFAAPDPHVATALGVEALRGALAAAALPAAALRRLIYVSSVGGDMISPANANRVAAGFDLVRTCDCIDLANGCMGFLSAFDVAARSIATGLGPVGIVVVELGHRVITPEDPRPFLVFGDAAVAAVLDRGRADEGVLASWLRNDGPAGGDVYLPNSLATGRLERVRFTAPSERMGDDAIAYLREAADAVLAEAGVALGDVEWVLPHQPNGSLLAAIIEALAIRPERVVRMVHDVGSVAAASIPVSLHRLLDGGRVRPGDRVLLLGVGAGISYGAILLRVGG